ncbi:glucosaminidase domain-containing protein [Chryseomicrobium palamuruense]|uniref:Glucosaminidase domain-containing protein n=1 Tax=Chryseomicrobium palamuruense TaxID=682973 RepID=A0ABV8UW61_9BACL
MSSIIDSNWFYLSTMQSISQPLQELSSKGATTSAQSILFSSMLNSIMNPNESLNWVSLQTESRPQPQFWSSVAPEMNNSIVSTLNSSIGLDTATSQLSFQATSLLQLEQKLGGKLAGTAKDFIAAGQKFDLNPLFLASIAMHETGNGTSKAIREKNNVAGMMGLNGLRTYATMQESIEAMASNLRRNYLNQGLTTITQIGNKYAPVGASNDPTGLNNHWVSGVNKKLNSFI